MTLPHEAMQQEVPFALGSARRAGLHRLAGVLAASKLGDAICLLALPWIAFELTGSAIVMSLLYAAEIVPVVLCGVAAGAWVDRHGFRFTMAAGGLARALLVAAIPLLSSAGLLRMWHLFVAASLIGLFTLAFDVGAVAAVPELTADLLRANAVQQSVTQAALMAGPALAGIFITASGARGALLASAAIFGAGFLAILSLPSSFQPGGHRRPISADISDAIVWLARRTAVRTLAIQAAVGNFGFGMVMSVLVFYLRDNLGAAPRAAGFALAAAGAGGIAGSILIVQLRHCVRAGRLYPRVIFAGMLGYALLFALPETWAVAFGLATVGACNMAWVVMTTSVRQTMIPRPLLGRVVALSRTLSVAAMPAGAALGGMLADGGIVRAVFAVAIATKVAELFISRLPEVREL